MPQITSGVYLTADNEYLVPDRYLSANNLKIGDVVRFDMNNADYRFKVTGTYIASESIYMLKDKNTLPPTLRITPSSTGAEEQKSIITC